jgi:hypothetical protein
MQPSEAPERIWVFEPDIFDNMSIWQDAPSPSGDTAEYVRADRITALEAENKRLRVALHAAINAPKGVVPACADEFYSPAHPSLAGEQP